MNLTQIESISKFYDGAEVFITGGSGFIGKVLIEKLLRSCPRVKTIHVLMRPKKNKTLAQRIQMLTDSLLFNVVRDQDPDVFEKINVIEGYVNQLNLGISATDWKKIKSCSVIFHAAASVRFDDPLKSAILLNTRGTREICNLAMEMPNLKSVIHVSTAFIQPKQFHTEERIYPFKGDWRKYIEWAEALDEDIFNILTEKLTDFAPNTYTFTKHMAEQVCVDYRKNFNLPITIYRPSIVSLSETEPIVGWCDSLNGPVGLVLLGALAISHVSISRGDAKMDIIPVDVCVKGMIASSKSSWKQYDQDKKSDIIVLNAASVRTHAYEMLSFEAANIVWRNPSINSFGIPGMVFTQCFYYAWLLRIFRNLIPSLLADTLVRIMGGTPQLMRTQRTIHNAERALQHFSTNNFTFDNFKFLDLNLSLQSFEKDDFGISTRYTGGNQEICEVAYRLSLKVMLGETEEMARAAKKRYPYIYFFFRTVHVTVALIALHILFNLSKYSYESIINFWNELK